MTTLSKSISKLDSAVLYFCCYDRILSLITYATLKMKKLQKKQNEKSDTSATGMQYKGTGTAPMEVFLLPLIVILNIFSLGTTTGNYLIKILKNKVPKMLAKTTEINYL